MITNRSTTSSTGAAGRVGVLLYDTSVEVDTILIDAIAGLRARGVVVGGILQHFGDRMDNGKRSMWIEDIASGATIRLDRPRGSGTVACILDPDALAQAACMLQRATAAGAELLVVNRFGNAEADGKGLRAELAEAICSGAAVLIPVRFSLLNDLEGFLGEAAHLLLPAPAAITDWVESLVGRREVLSDYFDQTWAAGTR